MEIQAMVEAARPVFIGPCNRPISEQGDPAAYLRSEFDVAPALTSAVLYVTALGIVEPYVNGTRVGDEVLEPGWTSYRHRLVVRSHDISGLLKQGLNAFGAVVGEGWALGRIGDATIGHRRIFADRAALLAAIELRYPDRVEFVATDGRFRAGEGSVRSNGIYDGVTIDAQLEPEGWSEPGFDDSAWGAVEPIARDVSALVAPVGPPIRRIEELAPVKVWSSEAGTVVVDFGQNISGWVRLRLSGRAGDTITVRHAEVLVDGVPDYTTLRSARATDRFVLRGSGTEEFEPRFTFHGFRYAEIEGLSGPLDPGDARAVVIHSDMARTGWFETSNAQVNRLHENVVWSMRDNFVGVPTDCPQRDERLGWTGDINAFSPTACYLYDVRGVLESWLADLAAEQRAFGFVPYVVPYVLGAWNAPTALWSDVAVSLPWNLYWEYGDEAILRRSYESMVSFIGSVEGLLDSHGLWSSGFQFGDWLDPDAPMRSPARGKTDGHLVASAFFTKVAREMAETARVLGHSDDAQRFSDLADRVRNAFRSEYVSHNGRVVNESPTAYALAIEFGLLDHGQLVKAGERLADLVRRANYKIATGFAGTPHIAHALTRTGHTEDAYRLLLREEQPSFLYPVLQGATTIWERWDALLPDGSVNPSGMTSLNHYALGSIAHWLHTVVAGLEATSPGYETIRIAPQPGGSLTHVGAAHDTVRGRVSVEWRREPGTMSVSVAVPSGTTAVVELPHHPSRASHVVREGAHSWTYEIAQRANRLTVESPVRDLLDDPGTWAAISAVLSEDLPDLGLRRLAEGNKDRPLSQFLDDLPGISGALRDKLASVLASL